MPINTTTDFREEQAELAQSIIQKRENNEIVDFQSESTAEFDENKQRIESTHRIAQQLQAEKDQIKESPIFKEMQQILHEPNAAGSGRVQVLNVSEYLPVYHQIVHESGDDKITEDVIVFKKRGEEKFLEDAQTGKPLNFNLELWQARVHTHPVTKAEANTPDMSFAPIVDGEGVKGVVAIIEKDINQLPITQTAEANKAKEKIEVHPAIIGEGRPANESAIFFRWATADDISRVTRGIHLPNSHLGESVYNSSDTDGTYFAYLGNGKEQTRYLVPADNDGAVAFNWPAYKPDLQFANRTDESRGNPRYAVAILLRVTDTNFDTFRDKIGEVTKVSEGEDKVDLKTEFSQFTSPEAMITTGAITSEDIHNLGTDVKIVVYDRENPNEPLDFQTWIDATANINLDQKSNQNKQSAQQD